MSIEAVAVEPYDGYAAVVAVAVKDESEDVADLVDLLNLKDAFVGCRQSSRVPRSVRYFDQTS